MFLTNPTEISDCFAASYNELFNSVGYDVNDMNTLFHEVCGDVHDYTVHSTLISQGRSQDLIGGGGGNNYFF